MLVSLLRDVGRSDCALEATDAWLKVGFTNTAWGMRVDAPVFEARYRLIRALLLLDLERNDEAEVELRQALPVLEVSPECSGGDVYYVRLVSDQSRRTNASRCNALASGFLLAQNHRTSSVPAATTQSPASTSLLPRADELRAQGRSAEAEELLRRALRSVEVFDDSYPQKLSAVTDLAIFLLKLNRLAESEPYLWRMSDAHTRTFGEGSLLAVRSMGLLGDVLVRQGKISEAERVLGRAVANLPSNGELAEAEELRIRAEFAVCLGQLHRVEEALAQVLVCHERLRAGVGDESPATRATARWASELHERMGGHELAEHFRLLGGNGDISTAPDAPTDGVIGAYFMRWSRGDPTLAPTSQVAPTVDPVALKASALQLKTQGKFDEAEALLRRALSAYEAYGPDHPEKMSATVDLAIFLADRGKVDEAEKLLRLTLDWSVRMFGEDARLPISTMGLLGKTLSKQQKCSEAERILHDAIERASRAPDIPATMVLRFRADRAACLVSLWRHSEAITELKLCYELLKAEFGQDHTETRAAARWISELSDRVGQPDDSRLFGELANGSAASAPTSSVVVPGTP